LLLRTQTLQRWFKFIRIACEIWTSSLRWFHNVRVIFLFFHQIDLSIYTLLILAIAYWIHNQINAFKFYFVFLWNWWAVIFIYINIFVFILRILKTLFIIFFNLASIIVIKIQVLLKMRLICHVFKLMLVYLGMIALFFLLETLIVFSVKLGIARRNLRDWFNLLKHILIFYLFILYVNMELNFWRRNHFNIIFFH